LVAEGGRITNPLTDESLTFGALAAEAAAMEVPGSARPRPREQWRILGRSQPRVDLMAKVTGAPVYGIDVDLPVKMSPRFGASALSVDTAPALAVPGVREIVPIETTTGSGFGIIADNTWAAFRGADALDVEWGAADYPENDEGIRRRLVEAVQADPSHALIDRGDVDTALSEAPADEIVEAEYSVPYLAHATLEPMNATARFADGRLEIWTGSQAPGIVQSTCASLLGIDADAVTVNVTFLGGGFGRRGEVDFPLYAAALARHLEGRPVKVTWSREEDTRHDTYRPAALGRFRAHVPAGEAARAVEMRIAAPSIIRSMLARTYPSIPPAGPDKTITDGAFNQPVATPHFRVSGHEADITIPVGFWRAVGNSYNGWFHESFMDEMAEKAGMDPLDYRLATMGDDPRFDPARGVLRRVAEMSGWGGSLPSGMGRGIAHVLSFGTWTAMVVEVDSRGGEINLTRCWIAADPGEVLDPRNFTDQLTGAAIFGFSSAIEGLHFEDGMVVEGNFWDYPFLTMAQAPRFEVSLLESAPHMGGAGEVGTPPAVPALANAIFAATGQRLRAMPFSDHVTFAV
ncbi:MAG: xanthine dehydrogenase family protein molybdopterin-binding subunit, partial [Rubricella sp.]